MLIDNKLIHSQSGENIKATKLTDNLCDSCALCFADCPAEYVVFGNGIGNDNVIECGSYTRVNDD